MNAETFALAAAFALGFIVREYVRGVRAAARLWRARRATAALRLPNCLRCGLEIRPRALRYTVPRGSICVNCWEHDSEQRHKLIVLGWLRASRNPSSIRPAGDSVGAYRTDSEQRSPAGGCDSQQTQHPTE